MGDAGIRALREGHAFVDFSSWRKVAVTGSDAVQWLNDLVTNRVDDLGPREARRTLLLSRTGHVKADVHVTSMPEGLLLVQDPIQPSILEQLDRYVLSSDVALTDVSDRHRLIVVADGAPNEGFAPFPFDGLAGVLDAEEASRRQMPENTFELWRIRRGIPRFGVDLGEDAIPAEAGWDGLVDRTKGCFLGQESVAKVRNLGHPTRVMVSLRAKMGIRPGESVLQGEAEVGRITGVAPDGDGYAVLARVKWDAREAHLGTSEGVSLTRRS